MKKIWIILAFLAILPGPQEVLAQRATSSNFGDKLWYGGGFDVGLSSSTFFLGLSPSVAYKLTPNLSAGLRLPLDYTYAKFFNSANEAVNYNNLDYGIGTFSRFKFLRNLFVHAEYNYLWVKEPVQVGNTFRLDPENPTKLLTEAFNRDELNVGLGYSSGNTIGYEISLLYNALEDPNSITLPWQIRVGLNYNF